MVLVWVCPLNVGQEIGVVGLTCVYVYIELHFLEWPGQGAAMVRDMAYEIVLPESPVPNLIYEVSVRSPITGRFSLFDTFAASPDSDRSVHLIQGVEPDTEYELVFRTRLGSKTSRPSPSLYVRTCKLLVICKTVSLLFTLPFDLVKPY